MNFETLDKRTHHSVDDDEKFSKANCYIFILQKKTRLALGKHIANVWGSLFSLVSSRAKYLWQTMKIYGSIE